MVYRFVLFVKLVCVVLYAGGLVTAVVASSPNDRRRAVHGVASPALLAVWAAGIVLVTMAGIPLTELWIAGAFGLSLVSQLAAVRGVAAEDRRPASLVVAGAALVAVLALMVFRPTWSLLRS